MKCHVIAAALIALATMPALADDNPGGLYLGAGVGQFNLEIDDVNDATAAIEHFDSDDTTFKVFAGWRFMPFLAVELTYMDLGNPEDTIGGTRVETQISGVAPYMVGTLPLGPIELFARVGYYFYDIEINEQSVRSLDESDEDLAYGAGIGITLFDHLHARLEYEIIDVSAVDDANALWLSGAWRF